MKISLDTGIGASMEDYYCGNECTWCDACGDYGIMAAIKKALVDLGYAPHQAVLCFDIGCHGNMSDKLQGYRFHGLHGRIIPFAAGAKLSNPALPVIACGGDGASFSEGIGHLVHGIRSHYPIVFILFNNGNFGLTKGQASSVTWQEQPMDVSPNGIPEATLPSMDFIFSLQPTFVARSFSGDIPQMTEVIKEGIKHRGFAFIDILQACPTYNKFATHDWLYEHCQEVSSDHDPSDFEKARALAVDTSQKVATGILYRNEDTPNFYERLKAREGRGVAVDEVEIQDVSGLLKDFV